MGRKIMELLSLLRTTYLDSLYRKQIYDFSPEKGSRKAYRDQFRLSVKPVDEGGWAKLPGEKFSIYYPRTDFRKGTLMNKLYFNRQKKNGDLPLYEYLFTQLYPDVSYNKENKEKYNHFLMQLKEDEIETLLDIDSNIAIIDDWYQAFLIKNYSKIKFL